MAVDRVPALNRLSVRPRAVGSSVLAGLCHGVSSRSRQVASAYTRLKHRRWKVGGEAMEGKRAGGRRQEGMGQKSRTFTDDSDDRD